MRSPLA